MRNNWFVALTAILVLMVSSFTLSLPEAKAQPTPIGVTCVARSPSAWGQWTHADGQYACQRALYECAIRTPYGQNCVVTRWWYVY